MLHQLQVRSGGQPLPLTEHASETCLALPFFTEMSAAEVAEVCSAIREILRNSENDRSASAKSEAAESEAATLERAARPHE